MDVTCKNCGQTYTGHYCNNCGQPAATHQLNFHYLWHEIRYSLLHFDQGILYSLKQLFTRPGHSIRDFIEGKRVRHFKPVSLVLLLAAIYIFLYHYFNISFNDTSEKTEIESVKINEWMFSHYSWTILLTIPLYTIGTSIAFRKQGYNIAEYLILNTFKASQRLVINIALFPLLYYCNGTGAMGKLSLIIYIIDVAFIYWTNAQFFNKLSLKRTLLLTLLSQLIFLISLIILIAIGLLIYQTFLK